MTADLAQPRRARALARHLPRPALDDRRGSPASTAASSARAISPSTSAPMPATAPGRCVRAGARVVALEPQRLFHAFLAPRPARRGHAAAARRRARAGPGARSRSRGCIRPSPRSPTASPSACGPRRASRGVRWDAAEAVEVTTLDALIADARPAAVHQDRRRGLRGRGARRPGAAGALDRLRVACRRRPRRPRACLDRLAALGRYRFNLVEGERGGFALDRWLDRAGHRRDARRPRRATAARPTSTPASPMPLTGRRAATAALAGRRCSRAPLAPAAPARRRRPPPAASRSSCRLAPPAAAAARRPALRRPLRVAVTALLAALLGR